MRRWNPRRGRFDAGDMPMNGTGSSCADRAKKKGPQPLFPERTRFSSRRLHHVAHIDGARGLQYHRIRHLLEDAEHEDESVALVGKTQLAAREWRTRPLPVRRRRAGGRWHDRHRLCLVVPVPRRPRPAARAPSRKPLRRFEVLGAARGDDLPAVIAREHVPDFDAVARAAIDGDDLELAELGDAAIHRHDQALDGLVGSARDIAWEARLARRGEPVAAVDLLARLGDLERRLLAEAPHARIAEVLGFTPEHFAGIGIAQHGAGAEDLPVDALVVADAIRVGEISLATDGPAFLGGGNGGPAAQAVLFAR